MHTFKNNRTHLVTLVSLCVLFLFFGLTQFAYAQTPATVSTGNAPSDTDWLTRLGNTIGNFILYIGAYITGFGGLLLDASIDKFIVRINEMIGNTTPLGQAINNIWVLVRDICNLAFIFGFIYVGIRTIIDADSSSTKRMLASIIIGALLINFSLFFAKAIIDVSNYISYEIYTNLVDTRNGGSIALNFRDILGVRTIYTAPTDSNAFVNMTTGGNIAYYFMATLMLIIAGFVLAAGAILLIIRFVVLVLILCFSPVLFAATVFPATQEHARNLWGKLLSYSFFAPVYLLLLIVSINVLNGVVATMRPNQSSTISSALANQAAQNTTAVDSYGVILSFGVGIFFLIMSLQIATKFGIAGADRAMSMVSTAKGWGQKKLMNTALWAPRTAARSVVGATSKGALKRFDKWQAKDTTKQGFIGKATRKVLTATNIDRDIRGTLESGKKAKFGLENSYQDNKDYADERKKRLAATGTLSELKSTVADSAKKLRVPGGTLSDTEKVALERALADASVKNLEELEQEDRKTVIGFMSQSQIDGLEKSDNLSDAEKAELGAERKKTLDAVYLNNKELLSKANADSLSALGEEYLSKEENAVRLSSSQMDDLKKKLTPTELKNVSKAREDALTKLASGRTIATMEKGVSTYLNYDHIMRQKPGEIANMPTEVLKSLSAAPATQIPIAALSKISQDGTLSRADQKIIRTNIEAQISAGSLSAASEYDKWLTDSPLGKQFGI